MSKRAFQPPPPSAQQPPRLDDDTASLLLNYLGSKHPDWQQRIDTVKLERGLSPLQIVIGWCAQILDSGAHMRIPHWPELEPTPPADRFDSEGMLQPQE